MSDVLEQKIEEARPRRFRPYPEYKDSGVEWLGEIPAHWDTPKMWQISRAVSGGTPAKGESEYWAGDTPWVSPKDMKRRFIDSSEDKVSLRAIEDAGLRLLEPPALLIVVRGMILAHSFPVAVTTVPVTINQDMKGLVLREGVDPVFLAWQFEGIGRSIRAAIVEEAAHGTKAIRMDEWRSVRVAVAPPLEQRSIIAFLDKETARIDELVARKERLIELLQEKRTALITRAVTRGLDPDVPMKDSGVEWLGKIPAHWEVNRIRDAASELQTGPFGSQLHANEYVMGGHPVINPANLIDGGLVSDERITVDDATGDRLARHRLHAGDILFARRGELGRCGLVTEQEVGWLCGTGCLRLRVDHSRFRSTFLIRALSTARVADWLGLQSVGATMQNLNTSIIGRISLAAPPLTEQESIGAYLEQETARMDCLIAKIREAIDRLKEFRTALISAAVTGKIDVRSEVG